MCFDELCKKLYSINEIEAACLGGSRSTDNFDKASDYDLYLYVTELPSVKTRQDVLKEYCSYMEINNTYWETEDDCVLKDGIPIDILYRSISSFEQGIARTVEGFEANNGYTTCLWHNLINSRILFDKEGRLEAMQKRFDVPYPAPLRKNIILRNRKLLSGYLPSYDEQIKKAIGRNDIVSVNHRTAAFLESYFDIIFAMNSLTHPGEKREISYALKNCEILPESFEGNLSLLLKSLFSSSAETPSILDSIIKNLDESLAKAGFPTV